MEKQDFLKWAAKLEQNYIPNADVLARLKSIDLIALVGPTGVGKTTIIERLNLPYVLSDVTRLSRGTEKNGREYYFRSDYFDILNEIKRGEYVQFLVANNNEFYGTRLASYPKEGPAVMAIIARALPHFRTLGFRNVIPFYILPPSYVEWMRRVGTGRIVDLRARMLEARESLPLALADPAYYLVLNDSLEQAVKEVKTVIAGGEITPHRRELARSSADLLFGRIGADDDLLL